MHSVQYTHACKHTQLCKTLDGKINTVICDVMDPAAVERAVLTTKVIAPSLHPFLRFLPRLFQPLPSAPHSQRTFPCCLPTVAIRNATLLLLIMPVAGVVSNRHDYLPSPSPHFCFFDTHTHTYTGTHTHTIEIYIHAHTIYM